MSNKKHEDSSISRSLITRDEAWKIISNQVAVQEQLRTKGEQTLRIVIALAVLVAGSSFAFGYNVPPAANPNITDSLLLVLGLHLFIVAFLIIIIFISFISFLYRHYEASRPSSLQPSLGGKQDHSVLVVANNDYRELLGGKHAGMRQYEDWIASNNETLSNKRQQLHIANQSLTLLVIFSFLAIYSYVFTMSIELMMLIFLDALFVSTALFGAILTYIGRDEPLSNWRSLPFTKKQKEYIPYLDTTEFQIVYAGYTLVTLLALLALLLLLTGL